MSLSEKSPITEALSKFSMSSQDRNILFGKISELKEQNFFLEMIQYISNQKLYILNHKIISSYCDLFFLSEIQGKEVFNVLKDLTTQCLKFTSLVEKCDENENKNNFFCSLIKMCKAVAIQYSEERIYIEDISNKEIIKKFAYLKEIFANFLLLLEKNFQFLPTNQKVFISSKFLRLLSNFVEMQNENISNFFKNDLNSFIFEPLIRTQKTSSTKELSNFIVNSFTSSFHYISLLVSMSNKQLEFCVYPFKGLENLT